MDCVACELHLNKTAKNEYLFLNVEKVEFENYR